MKIKNWEQFNEKIFQDQYDLSDVEIQPGDVIIAMEDIKPEDVDYAKYSKSWLGKISKLNISNMVKYDGANNSPLVVNKGLIGIVLNNGEFYHKDNWVGNIKDDSGMMIAFKMLYKDGKVDIKKYDDSNNEETKVLAHIKLTIKSPKTIVVGDNNVEVDTSSYKNYSYDMSKDELIIRMSYDLNNGKSERPFKIRNASQREDIIIDGKKINEI